MKLQASCIALAIPAASNTLLIFSSQCCSDGILRPTPMGVKNIQNREPGSAAGLLRLGIISMHDAIRRRGCAGGASLAPYRAGLRQRAQKGPISGGQGYQVPCPRVLSRIWR